MEKLARDMLLISAKTFIDQDVSGFQDGNVDANGDDQVADQEVKQKQTEEQLRKQSLKVQCLSLFVSAYLVIECFKLTLWTFANDPDGFVIKYTAPYCLVLGMSGKLIYIAIISNILNAVVCRLIFLVKERSKQLDFVLEPLKLLRRLREGVSTVEATEHEKNFKNGCDAMFAKANSDRKLNYVIGNVIVGYGTVRCILESELSQAPLFLIAYASHGFESWFHLNGNVVTGCLWNASLFFIRMRLLTLKDKVDGIVSSLGSNRNSLPTVSGQVHNTEVTSMIEAINQIQVHVTKFDVCMKGILSASTISFLPVFISICYMVHSVVFGGVDGGDYVFSTLMCIMMPVFIMERLVPMYHVAQLWSLSRSMYPTLNSIQVHCKTLSTHERLKLLTVIKSIGSDR